MKNHLWSIQGLEQPYYDSLCGLMFVPWFQVKGFNAMPCQDCLIRSRKLPNNYQQLFPVLNGMLHATGSALMGSLQSMDFARLPKYIWSDNLPPPHDEAGRREAQKVAGEERRRAAALVD